MTLIYSQPMLICMKPEAFDVDVYQMIFQKLNNEIITIIIICTYLQAKMPVHHSTQQCQHNLEYHSELPK